MTEYGLILRQDPTGRRPGGIRRAAARWLDAVWETARLVVEVDGRHHMDAAQYWADMDRDNDLTVDGYRVLRFPAFLVRCHPGYVAGRLVPRCGRAWRIQIRA